MRILSFIVDGVSSQILVLSPLAEYPATDILKSLEQAYSLREELDPKWAARPVLAISRSIIEAHGGWLWANANAPRGTVFQFTLPIREERMYEHLR